MLYLILFYWIAAGLACFGVMPKHMVKTKVFILCMLIGGLMLPAGVLSAAFLRGPRDE